MSNFNDIYGQDQIKNHLQNAIETGMVSHAYIITGEKYSGKEFIAGVFAQALLCEAEESKPCGKCHSCSQAMSNNNPDIVTVTHEKPNVIGVDEIREQVNEDILIKPYGGRRKVYIIPEAEKMNQQAQNALLKTFEEPPEYAVILLLVTNSEELLPTIRSRAVEMNMKPVADSVVKDFLVKVGNVAPNRLDICVAFARGNLGKALMFAQNEEFDSIRENAIKLLKYAGDMDVAELIASAKNLSESQMDINDFLDICMVWYRDILLFKATNDANDLIFKEEIQYIRKVAQILSYSDINEILEAFEKAKGRLAANVNFELTMELLFITIQEKQND